MTNLKILNLFKKKEIITFQSEPYHINKSNCVACKQSTTHVEEKKQLMIEELRIKIFDYATSIDAKKIFCFPKIILKSYPPFDIEIFEDAQYGLSYGIVKGYSLAVHSDVNYLYTLFAIFKGAFK